MGGTARPAAVSPRDCRGAIALWYVSAPCIGAACSAPAWSTSEQSPPARLRRDRRYFAFATLRLGCSIVPVHCFAPQRHSQIFFNRAVCASARVMP